MDGRKPGDAAKGGIMRPEIWMAKKHAYLNADITEAWAPVGVLLDESEDDILEELRFDIHIENDQGEVW